MNVHLVPQVQEALERNMAGRTVVVVAHRLSTVAHADRIVVLDGGEVVEQGPPDDLYKQKGLYYRLVKKQMIKRQDSTPEANTEESLSLEMPKPDPFGARASPSFLRNRWTNPDQSDTESNASMD